MMTPIIDEDAPLIKSIKTGPSYNIYVPVGKGTSSVFVCPPPPNHPLAQPSHEELFSSVLAIFSA